MLDILFRRLTAASKASPGAFEAATRIARRPHWYVEGAVPDTIDGRFAVLSTIVALVLIRLEQDGEAGDRASVALIERFVDVMESEHRELGLGDPTLGKTVRKLVGALSRRTDLWRSAVGDETRREQATAESLYKAGAPEEAVKHSAAALGRHWAELRALELEEVMEGHFA